MRFISLMQNLEFDFIATWFNLAPWCFDFGLLTEIVSIFRYLQKLEQNWIFAPNLKCKLIEWKRKTSKAGLSWSRKITSHGPYSHLGWYLGAILLKSRKNKARNSQHGQRLFGLTVHCLGHRYGTGFGYRFWGYKLNGKINENQNQSEYFPHDAKILLLSNEMSELYPIMFRFVQVIKSLFSRFYRTIALGYLTLRIFAHL